MQGKGIMNNFTYLYDAHKFDKRSMEQYLNDVEAEDVILSAFDFTGAGNTIFGFKYWKEIDGKWQVKLAEYRATGTADIPEEQLFCPHCGRMRPKSAFAYNTKGMLHKHCRECESGAWDRQRREHGKTVAHTEPKPAVYTPVKPDRLIAPKLGEYDATLHYKKGQKNITFNATLSQQIREGQYTKCMLNTDRSHRQFLIFNRVEGANVTGAGSIAQSLLNVNSANIVRSLAARFNLDEGNNYYLHITKNLASKADIITIEILKARTREEYVRIAEQRLNPDKKDSQGHDEDGNGKEAENRHEETPETPAEGRPSRGAEGRPYPPAEGMGVNAPLLDFWPDFGDGHTAPPAAEEVIQMMIDRHLATERDLAAFLCRKGWELHEPVMVKKLKKFTV